MAPVLDDFDLGPNPFRYQLKQGALASASTGLHSQAGEAVAERYFPNVDRRPTSKLSSRGEAFGSELRTYAVGLEPGPLPLEPTAGSSHLHKLGSGKRGLEIGSRPYVSRYGQGLASSSQSSHAIPDIGGGSGGDVDNNGKSSDPLDCVKHLTRALDLTEDYAVRGRLFRTHFNKSKNSSHVKQHLPVTQLPSRQDTDLGPNPFRFKPRQQNSNKAGAGKCTEFVMICPKPFLHTKLGRLPPELREIIWKLVLFTPISRASESIEAVSSGAVTVSMRAQSTDQTEATNMSLLRSCRLIHREAQHILDSSNPFHFKKGSDFLAFVKLVVASDRKFPPTLRIDGLTEKRPWVRHYDQSKQKMEIPQLALDYEEAAKLLKADKILRKVTIDTKVGNELHAEFFFLQIHGYLEFLIDFVDDFHWVVRRAPRKDVTAWREDRIKSDRNRPSARDWGDYHGIWGNDRKIQVKMPEEDVQDSNPCLTQ